MPATGESYKDFARDMYAGLFGRESVSFDPARACRWWTHRALLDSDCSGLKSMSVASFSNLCTELLGDDPTSEISCDILRALLLSHLPKRSTIDFANDVVKLAIFADAGVSNDLSAEAEALASVPLTEWDARLGALSLPPTCTVSRNRAVMPGQRVAKGAAAAAAVLLVSGVKTAGDAAAVLALAVPRPTALLPAYRALGRLLPAAAVPITRACQLVETLSLEDDAKDRSKGEASGGAAAAPRTGQRVDVDEIVGMFSR